MITIATLLAMSISLFAQSEGTSAFKKFYLLGGGGGSSNHGTSSSIGAEAILKSNWLVGVSYNYLKIAPNNLPSDYVRGYALFIPDPLPNIKLKLVNFMGGKLFPTGEKTWITTQAGLSIVTGEKMTFTHESNINAIIVATSNYATYTSPESTIGAMLKLDFNWAICPYVGLGVGSFANLNSIESPVGIEFRLIAGWLNTKKKAGK